jgi:hypothetical protein
MKNVLGVYLLHEISDHLLQFEPFNYSRNISAICKLGIAKAFILKARKRLII